jgi:F420-dependent oxidoreductase-like protein
MQVCIFNEPHRGGTYDGQLRFVQHVEKCGFAGYFRADHYQAIGTSDGWPGPTDAWVTLGALARETSRLRLGTLVTSATFRSPGPLAVIVAQVDQMSGGRVEFGIGAGWYEREHISYGIPFPSIGDRFDRLEEQLQIITGLWRAPAGRRFSFHGKHYQLVDAPALPKPTQASGPPVIVGGRGPRRTPELAARHADEFNGVFQNVADTAEQFRRVTEAADRMGRAATGRPPLRLSVGIVVACGRTAEQIRWRQAMMYEKNSALPTEDPVVGSPAQLADRIGEFAQLGADRVYLRLADINDLDHLDLIAGEVLPQLD